MSITPTHPPQPSSEDHRPMTWICPLHPALSLPSSIFGHIWLLLLWVLESVTRTGMVRKGYRLSPFPSKRLRSCWDLELLPWPSCPFFRPLYISHLFPDYILYVRSWTSVSIPGLGDITIVRTEIFPEILNSVLERQEEYLALGKHSKLVWRMKL